MALSSTKHVPVVCVVQKSDTEARRTFESAKQTVLRVTGLTSFTPFERFFKVDFNLSLRHHEGPLPANDPKPWINFIMRLQERIDRLADALPGKKVFHIFIQGPSSLALGLGAVFGWKHPVVVYQWDGTGYKPVIKLVENLRAIKEYKVETYRFIEIPADAWENLTENTVVALGMAAHLPEGWVTNYLAEAGHSDWKVIQVRNTYGGTLKEEDWVPVIQELASVFYELQRRSEVKTIRLFHSMPVAMAFGLGMSLGNFIPIVVYNWQREEGTYYPVLELNKLESLL